MPLLYSLGQHGALEATQEELGDGEHLIAYLDDIYVASPVPDRVGQVHATSSPTLASASTVARRRFAT